MKKGLAFLIAMAFALCLLPVTALAATYSVDSAQLQTLLSGTQPPPASGDVINVTSDAVIKGTPLALPSGVTLNVPSGKTLTLSDGTLTISQVTPAASLVVAGGARFNIRGQSSVSGVIHVDNGGSIANNSAAATVMVSLNNAAPVMLGAGETITAAGMHTITFDANGGAGTMSAQTVAHNVETALQGNAFTRTDYVFAGWNTAANGSGTAYDNRAKVKCAADMKLYAQWVRAQSIIAGNTILSIQSAVYSDPAQYLVAAPLITNGWVKTVPMNLAAAAYGRITMANDQYACVYLVAEITNVINPTNYANMRIVFDVQPYYQLYVNGEKSGAAMRMNGLNGTGFSFRLPVPASALGSARIEHNGFMQTCMVMGGGMERYVELQTNATGNFIMSLDGNAGPYVPQPVIPIAPTPTGAGAVITTSVATTAVPAVPATGDDGSPIWMLLTLALLMTGSWLLARREA